MTRSFQRNGRAIVIVSVLAVGLLALSSGPLSAQTTPAEQPVHDHMAMMSGSGWSRMWDGVAFATINAQGGLRGNTDVRSQNWIMGMAARPLQSGTLTLSGMLSLEPLTVGRRGYSEIFQLGEAYKGLPVTDRQHPHDLFMELAAIWHRHLTTGSGLTLAGGLVGSPAYGPPAFMHRASASDNPLAPLSHHTFDSTHITLGVLTAGYDRKPFALEASVFHGREPDDQRYDLDLGKLDSASGRGWWRPNAEWSVQASAAFLRQPEQLEPGNQHRMSASVGWLRKQTDDQFTAVTVAGGQVKRNYSTTRALLVEATRHIGAYALFGRYDGLGIETEHLLFPTVIHKPHAGELIDSLVAFSAGAMRDLGVRSGFQAGLGAQLTMYHLPERLVATHGAHPVSFQVYLRVRPRAPAMGRMWDMTMTDSMPQHDMASMRQRRGSGGSCR